MDRIPMQQTYSAFANEELSTEYKGSTELPRSDLQTFDNNIENATLGSNMRRSWWNRLLRRAGRESMDESRDGAAEGLLAGVYALKPSSRRKRSWYNYCIFGGIAGSTLLALILAVNLSLTMATYIWTEDIDLVLRNWGRPGSGTEGMAWYPTDFTRDIIPIPCHSHNDYWRKVPMFSAFRAGCTGIEADVWLFDEDLYVGHNTASLTRNRTFQSLYINPLVKLLEGQNKHTDFYNGSSHGVFDTDPGKPVTLLVDVKTGGAETWPWVLAQLQPLRERGWLSFMENNEFHERPVTVVGTGNTPFDVLIQNTTYRDAFFDAPLETMWEPHRGSPSTPEPELDHADIPPPRDMAPANAGQGMSGVTATSEFNTTNSYYASVSFDHAVGRIWRGRLSPKQIQIIRGHIRGAHKRGLKVRYWDLPAWPLGLRNHIWDVLVREGADTLNVDDLRAASRQVW